MGVKRAVDLAIDHAARQGALTTLGPLIHNRQTLDMLRDRGVTEHDADAPPPAKGGVLIRAHGVPPALEQRFSQAGCDVIDGTCPKVKTVQMVIKKYRERGYSIIITGDQGHAEVVGLLGYAGNDAFLIQTAAEIPNLPQRPKWCLVSQTTFDSRLFDEIAKRIKAHCVNSDVVVKKTICSATDKRQTETRSLATVVDVVVVVGGRESANTKRLASVVQECGKRAVLVETEAEIRWEDLAGSSIVGVTAGASTPGWMIKRVVDHIEFLANSRSHGFKNRVRYALDIAVNLNVIVSMGAVALLYASSYLQGYPFSWRGSLLCYLYFFSMYLWNSLASIEIMQHLGLTRYRFYRSHKTILFGLCGLGMAILLAVSFSVGGSLFMLVLFATVAGAVYHVPIVPRFLQGLFRNRTLKDFPTSRDLSVALAWAVLLTFIPQAEQGALKVSLLTGFCFAWIFFLSYIRSLMFDMRDIEGDRIMGRETLITIIGERRVRAVIRFLLWLCAVIIVVFPLVLYLYDAPLFYARSAAIWLQLPVLGSVALFIRLSRSKRIKQSALFSILADMQLFIAAAAIIAAALIVYR